MKKRKTLCPIRNKRTLQKLLLTMKLILLFIVFGVFQLSATLYSQNGLFTIKMENTSMREVLKEIEKQSELRFFYNDLLTNVDKNVSLVADNLKIEELLNKLFDGSEITYKMMENNLVLISPKALLQQIIATSYPSFCFSKSLTCCGLALPLVAFMAWPTRELKAFSLPLR